MSKAPEEKHDFPDTKIVPPVHIGDDCVISGSTIGPNASIAPGARIEGSSVRYSIIGSNVILDGCDITDSVIGDNCCVEGTTGKVNIGDHSRISR